MEQQPHKAHRARQSGSSAKKISKSEINKHDKKKPNPKAFGFTSSVKAKRSMMRTAEKEQRRLHIPTIDRSYGEPSPYVVVVQGPPQVGKSLLIKCLIKHYTKLKVPEVRGPVTVVSGKKRRLQFVECPNDINGMIDCAKFADLALLLIDASHGFEMETFEFLNLMQNHGLPNVMGVLTHLDKFKDKKKLRKTKQHLKHRFGTELYHGAKLFKLSGLIQGKYTKKDIGNLAEFISVMKFHSLSWRISHPYILVDRFEDVTPPERVHVNNKCDRNVAIYGYLRGCNLKKGTKVHIAGAGDYSLAGVTGLADPCPLPSAAKKKGLRDKEKLFYAPMSGLGDLLYDKDAVYININDHFVQFSEADDENGKSNRKGKYQDVGVMLVKSLQNTKYPIDKKLEKSIISLFSQRPNGLSDATNNAKDMDDDTEYIHGKQYQTREGTSNGLGEKHVAEEMESLHEAADVKKESFGQCTNLIQLVYGKSTPTSATLSKEVQDSSDSDESDDDEFFRAKVEGNKKLREVLDGRLFNMDECSKFNSYGDLKSSKGEEVYESIRDRFVTGDWSKAAQRNQVSKGNSEGDDSDDAVSGDFEDLETVEKHQGHIKDNSGSNAIENEYEICFDDLDFYFKYDGSESPEKEIDEKDGAKFHCGQPNEIGLVDKMKEEIEFRKQMNIAELNDLDEMVEHFDPCHPVLVGGIGLGEENVGCMQARLKRHRWWHKKVLKTRDPIILSIGWRRFQTIPVYAIEDRNGWHRMLKYTPEHMHCLAMFWGPLAPPQTGVVAIQNFSNNQIFKKTALIKDMFTSDLEVAQCEGKEVRTVSGIRGQVKKAAKEEIGNQPKRKGGQPREGIARCTFEDRILLSDVVFMRGWADVEIPRFYNPLTTAMQPSDKIWQGMKTIAELRREHNLSIPVNKDSLYKAIGRRPRKFNPLVIPKSLQAALPFESKPKDIPSRKRLFLENSRAVVMEPQERKVHALIQHLKLIRNEKMKKRKLKEARKRNEVEAERAKDKQLTRKRQRGERQERYREQDKLKKKIRVH
ncbi:Bms1-type G domain-containing protein [Citrus sinensis]|nr:Bms1-type G domain-containing protein [Citrus sinensis]